MRIFAAVDLSPASRAAVADVVAALRGHAAFGTAFRWVAARNLHLTLRFLGDVRAGDLARVERVLQPDLPQSPFRVVLEAVGVFPQRGAPRVVWIGAGRGARELGALHAEVAARLQRCGYPPDVHPFRPHVTIGRVKRVRSADAARIHAALGSLQLRIPPWRVDRVALYHSVLSASGPIYRMVASASLGPE